MRRVARLVVHVEHALRLASSDDEHELRLALVLLDSAAELILHRESEYQLGWQRYPEGMLRSLQAIVDAGKATPEVKAQMAKLRAQIVPKKERRRIEREFIAKAEYLETKGIIPTPYIQVLKKLH